MLEPNVPEYLVDNRLIGDKRDDPHCPAAAGAKQRIFLPDLTGDRGLSSHPEAALFQVLYANCKDISFDLWLQIVDIHTVSLFQFQQKFVRSVGDGATATGFL